MLLQKKNQVLFIFILFWEIFLSHTVLCQNYIAIDSLYDRLEVTDDSELKLAIIENLAWHLVDHKPDTIKPLIIQAIDLSRQINEQEMEATLLNRLGEAELNLGNSLVAERKFLEALSVEKQYEFKYGIARTQSNLSMLYADLGDYYKAVEAAFESLQYFEELGNVESVLRAYQRLVYIHEKDGNYGEALKYLNLKLETASIQNNHHDHANTLYSLGRINQKAGSLRQALKYYKKSLNVRLAFHEMKEASQIYTALGNIYLEREKFDSSIIANNKSLSIKDSLGDSGIVVNLINLGVLANKKADFNGAKRYYTSALQFSLKGDDAELLSNVHNNLGDLYFKQKKYDSAFYHLNSALDLNPASLSIQIELFWNFSSLHYAMGNYHLAEYYKQQYGTLKDQSDSNYKLTVMEKDNFEELQQSKELLLKDNQIQSEKIKRRNQLIWLLIGLISLLLTLFFFAFQNLKIKKDALFVEKESLVKQRKIDELIKDHEVKQLGARITGQDLERKRIARELHDTIGSILSTVKIHFRGVENNLIMLQEQNRKQYFRANELLDEACEEVRRISHDLISSELYRFGLNKAVESLVNSIHEAEPSVEIDYIATGLGSHRFSYDVEINFYRIIQELISNTLKHAYANNLTIQLILKEKNLHLQVQDDGKGFDTNDPSEGIGLKNIQARVDQLGGDLIIDSNKNSGTTISIDIAYEDESDQNPIS